MSQLQTVAATILAAWQHEGRRADEPIPVADLLDRLFPYAMARRRLGIDVSEDYEALMLRLLAEEDALATVLPVEAAELARVTMQEKLPDLAVLHLLRAATLRLQVDPALAAAHPVPPPPGRAEEARWRPDPVPAPAAEPAAAAAPCWQCGGDLPVTRAAKFCPHCGADQRPPVCTRCHEPLERGWKHCPECGQRAGAPGTPPP